MMHGQRKIKLTVLLFKIGNIWLNLYFFLVIFSFKLDTITVLSFFFLELWQAVHVSLFVCVCVCVLTVQFTCYV